MNNNVLQIFVSYLIIPPDLSSLDNSAHFPELDWLETSVLHSELLNFDTKTNLITEVERVVDSYKEIRTQQRQNRLEPVLVPFRDIVISGLRDQENAWQRTLERALSNRFYSFEEGFRVTILDRPSIGKTIVYGDWSFQPLPEPTPRRPGGIFRQRSQNQHGRKIVHPCSRDLMAPARSKQAGMKGKGDWYRHFNQTLLQRCWI